MLLPSGGQAPAGPKTAMPVVDTNTLVDEHLYLVQHLVNQVSARFPRHVDRAELWSAGAHGLVDASRRYDPNSGVPFSRYAAIRIRGAIIDSTRTRDWASRGVRRQGRELSEAEQRFESRHGRTPEAEELAEELGITVAELRRRQAASASATLLQLDLPIPGYDGEGATVGERLPETDPDALPTEALEHAELVGTVRTAVAHLDGVQREVIERHFFTGDLLRDIAADLGLTEARVSQIRSEALHAMRAYFSTSYEGVPSVPEGTAGVRRRSAYVAEVAAHSTWRTRLDAASGAGTLPLAAGA